MEKRPRLRDSSQLETETLYPLNVFPEKIIRKIGGYFVYLIYTGRADVEGDDWGDAFADAIGGAHLKRPMGVADVVVGKNSWSLKTVKSSDPFMQRTVRLISGRCSPDYSYGITDPHEDVQRTGDAVLGIWNERINIATDHYSRVRTAVLIRSRDLLSYTLFEEETQRYRTTDYTRKAKKNGNLIGMDADGNICFTWQPHGSQFTIHIKVPESAVKFQIRRPPSIDKQTVLKSIDFNENWVSIIRKNEPLILLPLYSLRMACGLWKGAQSVEKIGDVTVSTGLSSLDPAKHIVARAEGDSMLPKIHDGDYCVIERATAANEGEIVLIEHGHSDLGQTAEYALKVMKDAHTFVPLNRDGRHAPIVVREGADRVDIRGIFKGVLKRDASTDVYRLVKG